MATGENDVMRRWALVVGSKERRDLCTRAIAELQARGVTIGGVLQEAVLRDGERHGYDLRHIPSGRRVPLGRRGSPPPGVRAEAVREFCSFFFDDDAFAQARAWIQADATTRQAIVVDEVSKLEIAGGGHHDAIRQALDGPVLVVLSVRADQLFGVVERFGLEEPVATLDASSDVGSFASALTKAIRGG